MSEYQPRPLDPTEHQTPMVLNIALGGVAGLALGLSGQEGVALDAALMAGGAMAGALKNYVVPRVYHAREVTYYKLCEKLNTEPNPKHLD